MELVRHCITNFPHVIEGRSFIFSPSAIDNANCTSIVRGSIYFVHQHLSGFIILT